MSQYIFGTSGSGTGDVSGPASATDNAVVRFDGTTGKLIQNGVISYTDAGILNGPTAINTTGRIFVNGASDDFQLAVEGHSSQTLDILVVRRSDGTTYVMQVTEARGTAIRGTESNDSAATGFVGEYLTASLATGSATSLTNATGKTVISQSLTAGDWNVWGWCGLNTAASTTVNYFISSVSQVNNTISDYQLTLYNNVAINTAAAGSPRLNAVMTRMSLSATTTVYLVAQCNFATSTATAFGTIYARRIR
jgi:hypothetical protein